MQTTSTGNRFPLPMRVTKDANGRLAPYRAGAFDAGWSVAHYSTANERAAAMREFADARMPCWRRLEAEVAS